MTRSSKDQRLPDRERIRSRADFERIYAGREAVRNAALTICWRENGLGHPRLGLSVGRRLGPAVARNRIKRLIREVYRQEKDAVPGSLDLVVIPKDRRAALDLESVRSAFRHLMKKIAARRQEPGRPAVPTAEKNGP
jgi:ribonuclease P protein component